MLLKNKIVLILIPFFSVTAHGQRLFDCDVAIDESINRVNILDLGNQLTEVLNIDDGSFKVLSYKYQFATSTKVCCDPFEPFFYVFDNEYLMTAGLEGSGIVYSEVGYTNKKYLKSKNHFSLKNDMVFVTNNGIRLGMTEGDFRDSLPAIAERATLRRNIQDIYTIFYYQCGNTSDGYYQQGANIAGRPRYIARYVFRKGILVKFGFGFIPFHPLHEFDEIIR